MREIIIRKKIVSSPCSREIRLTNGRTYSQKKLIEKFGYEQIMEKIFEEDPTITEKLHQAYDELQNSEDKENEYFLKVYRVSSQLAACVDGNIYLFHLAVKEEDRPIYGIVPWYYVDSQKYVGSGFYQTEQEILESLRTKSILEFFEFYKSWCFPGKCKF